MTQVGMMRTGMLRTGMTRAIAAAPPRHQSGIVGAHYLLTTFACLFVLFFHGRLALAADLIATIVYIAGTILFYSLSKKPDTRQD
jgi:hypothetical protein